MQTQENKTEQKIYVNPVKKVIPSKLETGFQKFLYRYVGPHIPSFMTPNQMTLIGALGGLFSILCTLLTNLSVWFFIGTILGIFLHLVADDLDGYVARTRGMSSKAGAYFDLITDVLFSTFLLIALGMTPYVNVYLAMFAAPLYGVINVTAMNYIIYLNEFLFPRLGPIEAQLCYMLLAVICMIFGSKAVFTVGAVCITAADILLFLGMLPMYYEMFRLEIRLFQRLKQQEKKDE